MDKRQILIETAQDVVFTIQVLAVIARMLIVCCLVCSVFGHVRTEERTCRRCLICL